MLLKKYSVMYVEDDPIISELMQSILEEHAQKVYIAFDGDEGLALYEKYHPDIIVSDIVMPKMDGLTMAKQIKQINSNQLIAILSAYDNTEYLHQAIEINIDAYIIKPITEIELFIAKLESLALQLEYQEKLQLSAQVFSFSKQGIIITDADGTIVEVNDAFTQITGYSKSEAIGEKPSLLKSQRYESLFYQQMWEHLTDEGMWEGELWNRRKNGDLYAEFLNISCIRNIHGDIRYYIGIFSDITIQKNYIKELERRTHYDTLTNLPNRVLIEDRLNQAMSYAQKTQTLVAIVFLDIDNFQEINKRYGVEKGDKYLISFSQSLNNVLSKGDTLGRMGGDEFVLVLSGFNVIQESIPLIQKIHEVASNSRFSLENDIDITVSIGLTFYPQEGELGSDQLIRQAYNAMYHAKLAGKNQYKIFDTAYDKNLKEHLLHINEFKNAIKENQLTLYFQPQVDLVKGKVTGAEALVRWNHPEKGFLMPGSFLPTIEHHSLSIDLGEWVLNAALKELTKWQSHGIFIPISVNINAKHLQKNNFVSRLKEILSRYPKINPQYLILEILETSVLSNLDQVTPTIIECNDLGIEFSLDDFGTGYSSLSYLKKLPTNEIKIDQSFVMEMTVDSESLAIVEGVLELARIFNRTVIAEGVESDEHIKALLRSGCQRVQGYVIAKPMRGEAFVSWINNWVPNPFWKTISRLPTSDLDLLFAQSEHRKWIQNTLNYIEEKAESSPPIEQFECRLGKWLRTEAEVQYSKHPLYKSLITKHTEIHQLVTDIVTLKKK